jgi:hypothetical protein
MPEKFNKWKKMEKIYFLIFTILLFSCNREKGPIFRDDRTNPFVKPNPWEKTDTLYYRRDSDHDPKVLGQVFKFGNLEIAQYDIEGITFNNAKKACQHLGLGWRMPTKAELNILYDNKEKIGSFTNYGYWSSEEFNSGKAYAKGFGTGLFGMRNKNNKYYVRAVRSF